MTFDPATAAAVLRAMGDLTTHLRFRRTVFEGQPRTAIDVDRRIPSRPGGPAVWRVTTDQRRRADQARFAAGKVAEKINSAAATKGRRLFCVGLYDNQPVAALSYHVPAKPSEPLLVTAIAVRTDVPADSVEYAESLGAILLLKEYVHALAKRLGRDPDVLHPVAAGSNEMGVCRRWLGFELRSGSTRSRDDRVYLRQPPTL